MVASLVRSPFKVKYDWVKILNEVSTVALDTESFGLEREYIDGSAYNLGFSISTKYNGEYVKEYIPFGHVLFAPNGGTDNMPQKEAVAIIEAVNTCKVFLFNAPYDVRVVAETFGIKLKDYVDLMRLSHLDDENYFGKRNLNNMVAKYCKDVEPKKMTKELKTFIDTFGWGALTFEMIDEYATHDAYITYRLAEEVVNSLAKRGEADAIFNYWTNFEVDTYDTLYNMKSRGVLVDLEVCQNYVDLGTQEIARIKDELGFDPGVRKNMERVFWDELGMPVIMAKRKGKPDSPTFNKDAMERYELMLEARSNKDGSELAGKVLAFRGWQKAISSYYQKYIDLVFPDGKVRPSYLVHGTVSGRFACIEPNLQQLPKEATGKKPWVDTLKQDVFRAQEGYELWEFDYSQLEFRMGAHYANEPKLLEAFNDDSRDVFTEMSVMLGMPRQDCKTLTYSINYGAGAQRIMDAFNVNQTTARGHIQNFYETYPNLRRVNMIAKQQAERNLKIPLWSGRYRHFQYKEQGFKAFNSFIQGGAADLVKLAMNRINKELPEVRMLLQVHDSLIFELPVARIEEYKVQIMDIMANPGMMDWSVHLKTDGHKLGAG